MAAKVTQVITVFSAESSFIANEELIKSAAASKAPCCFLNLIAGDRICVFAEKDGNVVVLPFIFWM